MSIHVHGACMNINIQTVHGVVTRFCTLWSVVHSNCWKNTVNDFYFNSFLLLFHLTGQEWWSSEAWPLTESSCFMLFLLQYCQQTGFCLSFQLLHFQCRYVFCQPRPKNRKWRFFSKGLFWVTKNTPSLCVLSVYVWTGPDIAGP